MGAGGGGESLGEAGAGRSRGKHLWVALKHEITYRRPAFLDDELFASVMVEKVHGARAFYRTLIKRGEEVLAEVKSSWCCLDAETLKPSRIAQDIAARFFSKG